MMRSFADYARWVSASFGRFHDEPARLDKQVWARRHALIPNFFLENKASNNSQVKGPT